MADETIRSNCTQCTSTESSCCLDCVKAIEVPGIMEPYLEAFEEDQDEFFATVREALINEGVITGVLPDGTAFTANAVIEPIDPNNLSAGRIIRFTLPPIVFPAQPHPRPRLTTHPTWTRFCNDNNCPNIGDSVTYTDSYTNTTNVPIDVIYEYTHTVTAETDDDLYIVTDHYVDGVFAYSLGHNDANGGIPLQTWAGPIFKHTYTLVPGQTVTMRVTHTLTGSGDWDNIGILFPQMAFYPYVA